MQALEQRGIAISRGKIINLVNESRYDSGTRILERLYAADILQNPLKSRKSLVLASLAQNIDELSVQTVWGRQKSKNLMTDLSQQFGYNSRRMGDLIHMLRVDIVTNTYNNSIRGIVNSSVQKFIQDLNNLPPSIRVTTKVDDIELEYGNSNNPYDIWGILSLIGPQHITKFTPYESSIFKAYGDIIQNNPANSNLDMTILTHYSDGQGYFENVEQVPIQTIASNLQSQTNLVVTPDKLATYASLVLGI